jgi:hypothetical protein
MQLTEGLAMAPAASVSGFYLGHPSTYFNVGKIGEDQVEDMAQRRGMDVAELRGCWRRISDAIDCELVALDKRWGPILMLGSAYGAFCCGAGMVCSGWGQDEHPFEGAGWWFRA